MGREEDGKEKDREGLPLLEWRYGYALGGVQ